MLACGHRQHVRHKPPFVNRPWAASAAGRNAKIGEPLDCVRCDRLEWPDGFDAYKKTRIFSETTVPTGLRRDHATKSGVWAKIVVLDGRLLYTVDALQIEMELSESTAGIIAPEVEHRVEPVGSVRFFVEFYKAREFLA